MHGEDVNTLRRQMINVGLPHHPRELHLSHDELVRLIVAAPVTRPGRFTILEHLELGAEAASRVVRAIWGDW